MVTCGVFIYDGLHNQATTNPTGAPAGHSSSPGDQSRTCAVSGCHTGIAVQTRTNLISSDIPEEGYTPGNSYTITAAVSSANRNMFGFMISPQNAAGTKLGTMALINSTETQLLQSAKYITHKQAGITGSGGVKSWSFTWTAPAAGTGDVNFYGSFNIANGNGNATGDSIIKTTYTVSEKLVSGIASRSENEKIAIYPNPMVEQSVISNLNGTGISELRLFDMNGRQVRSVDAVNAASVTLTKEALGGGMYTLLLIDADKKVYTQKLVVR